MPRVAWATDLHLGHARPPALAALLAEVAGSDADVLVLAGDTGTAGTVRSWLTRLAAAFGRPVYFVLGNHDYYGGDIAGTRDRVRDQGARTTDLAYLWDTGVVPLSDQSALVGVDGWGDARYGNWSGSAVALNDFILIHDLAASRNRAGLTERLRRLGQESADLLESRLALALGQYDHVLVVTHVPPFAECAWHQGGLSDADWVPYFACQAVGDVLLSAAASNPRRSIVVVCGHTHGGGRVAVRPNLLVLTGEADYGSPRLQLPLLLP
jgi:3',5'-cyclic AMP phosphodiesterase CpdA